MTSPRLILLVLVLGLVAAPLTCLQARRGLDEGKEKLTDRNDADDLNHEVTALQTLHYLGVTPVQLKQLADLAGKTAEKPGPRKAVALSDRYHKSLQTLRDALADDDADKIDRASAVLLEAQEKESPDFDDVEITAEARKAAPGFVKGLSPRQLVGYVAGVAEDFPEPVSILGDALGQSRELKGKEWRDLRDDTAFQLGWLLAGQDEAADEKVRDEVTALLNKAAALDEKGWEEKRGDLEKQARDLATRVGPSDVVRHFVERVAAELLSNPRLPDAVKSRLARARGKPRGA